MKFFTIKMIQEQVHSVSSNFGRTESWIVQKTEMSDFGPLIMDVGERFRRQNMSVTN